MKGLIIKDLINLKSTLKLIGIIVLFFAAIFISQGNGFIYGIIIFMFAMMVVTAISYDDLARWDVYALTMPITRRDIVLGKYLLMGILNSIGAVLSLIIGSLASLELGLSLSMELFAIIGVTYLIAFIFGSLMIPLIYRFGTEKARLMLILCALTPTALFLIIDQLGIVLPSAADPRIYLFLLLVLTIAAVLLSFSISIKIYRKKEF